MKQWQTKIKNFNLSKKSNLQGFTKLLNKKIERNLHWFKLLKSLNCYLVDPDLSRI